MTIEITPDMVANSDAVAGYPFACSHDLHDAMEAVLAENDAYAEEPITDGMADAAWGSYSQIQWSDGETPGALVKSENLCSALADALATALRFGGYTVENACG